MHGHLEGKFLVWLWKREILHLSRQNWLPSTWSKSAPIKFPSTTKIAVSRKWYLLHFKRYCLKLSALFCEHVPEPNSTSVYRSCRNCTRKEAVFIISEISSLQYLWSQNKRGSNFISQRKFAWICEAITDSYLADLLFRLEGQECQVVTTD